MRHVKSRSGPFQTRPHFKLLEIEEMCTSELRAAGLLASSPEPIRIERFIEKRFGISPRYEELPDGVLGFTKFGRSGVEEIVVDANLDQSGGRAGERRLRTTLAHEAGHGLMHTHLFCTGLKPKALFGEPSAAPEIMCRDVVGEKPAGKGYDGRWWEFQANKAIGGLLMPRHLVLEALGEFTSPAGSFGAPALSAEARASAERALSETFDVNPVVARIRLGEVFPVRNEAQLLL